MRFETPLVSARLIRRYKRFLADVCIDGAAEETTAHCGNPGSMIGMAEPGSRIWLSENRNPKAKLDWRWELVDAGTSLVTVNTGRANKVVAEALAAGTIGEISGYDKIRPEVPYGEASRIDFLLETDSRPPLYLEVKSVTLRRPDGSSPNAAEFPDSVTKRGEKHLRELTAMVESGARAAMLFLVQRQDCTAFAPARDIDPAYARALASARDAGVKILCYACRVTPEEIVLNNSLPIRI